jgi:N-methylhydantoinase A/oxoprolinase/acetone carboxylase beta subunit
VEFLKAGPRPVPEILEKLDFLHTTQVGAEALFRREILGKAGLTPTDLLHVQGRYSPWDAQAAELALEVFSRFQFEEPDQLIEFVWSKMTETIVHAIVTFLTGRQLDLAPAVDKGDMGLWFFRNSLRRIHPRLETTIRLHLPIIGIGAPAGIFLPDVADMLHTDLILPDHHQVANAVGAIAGSVMVAEEILVYPKLSPSGLDVVGYYVQASDIREECEEKEVALARARSLCHERALGAALRSGADNPQVVIHEQIDGLDTYRIQAKAIGNPRLAM